MAADVLLRRSASWSFSPKAQFDYDALAGIAVGSEVRATIRADRSPGQHRYYWGLVRKVWEHQEHYETPEDVNAVFMYRLGQVREVTTKKGDVIIRPGSVAYDAMDQPAFHRHLQAVQQVIVGEILPKIQSDKLTREIAEYVGLPLLYRG